MWGTIKPGDDKITWHKGTPSYDDISKNATESGSPFDAVDIGSNGSRRVTLYVDDEGLLKGLDASLCLEGGTVLVGPVVVTGTDMNNGETVALTKEEVKGISFGGRCLIDMGRGEMIPVIDYKG